MLQLLKSPSNIFKNPLGMLENIALGQLSYNSQQLLAYWIFPLFKSFNHMLSGDSYTFVGLEAYLTWVSSYFNLIVFANLYSNNAILQLTVVHENFMNTATIE